MIRILEKKLNGINDSLEEVLTLLDDAGEDVLNYKPEPGKWSSVQILNHLCISETSSLMYMSKKVPDIDNQFRTGFKQQYRSFLLKFFLATPLKFKAPGGFGDMPDDLVYEDVKNDYLETRRGIEEIMRKISEANLNRAIMKHPRIGRINAVQTLDFFHSHFNHHRKQIESRIQQGWG
jgi:hypothetical protein